MEALSDEPLSQFDRLCIENPHILRKIVSHFPIHHRLNYVGAISRHFYETVCDMDKLKYRMSIQGPIGYRCVNEGDIPDDVFTSILNSDRIFDKLRLDYLKFNNQNLKKLKEVAEKHGSSIKSLKISDCWFNLEDDFQPFLEFLQKLPNLQSFKVNPCFFGEKSKYPSPQLIPPILTSLRKFHWMYHEEPIRDFNIYSRLISPHTIEKFDLESPFNNDIASFMLQQSKITSLYFDKEVSCVADACKHLKLENVNAGECSRASLQKLVKEHPTLKKLHVSSVEWTSAIVQSICQHGKQLQEVFMEINNENCASMLAIIQLKQLKFLHLELAKDFTDFDGLTDISNLKMPWIEEFRLEVSCPEFDADEVLQNFGAHLKNVKNLGVMYFVEEPGNFPEVNLLLESFEKVEVLHINCPNKFEEKFPHLQIFKCCDIVDISLLHLLEALPNLTCLQISTIKMTGIISTLFRSLAIHKKLEKLSVAFEAVETVLSDFSKDLRQLCLSISKYRIEFQDLSSESWPNVERCVDEAKKFFEVEKGIFYLTLFNCSEKQVTF